MRPFKVDKCDKHRYKAVCPADGCTFLAQSAFTSSFDLPPNLSPHLCGPEYSAQAVKRLSTAKYLAENTELREYFLQIAQKYISPAMIQRKAQKLGLQASYMNCVNTFKRLAREFYGDDRSQYPYLPSYIEVLNDREHRTCCDVNDGTFVRLAVVYREGIQAFSQYTDRGLCVDRTFLKTVIGGTLLVACFRNVNLQLQIAGIAVISGENQDNWDFLLRFLIATENYLPLETIQTHFFCFRHLMENFNRQFKSKPLKSTAWGLALTSSVDEFAKKAVILKRMNPEVESWLMDVGKDKWSLCYSLRSRFGTLGIHRATATRIRAATAAVQQFQRESGQTLGPIALNHAITTHARQLDGTQFVMPSDNTTRQAMALDASVSESRENRESDETVRVATIQMDINGSWTDFQVNVASMCAALGLPAHDIYTAGICHGFESVPPPEVDLEDVDHMDDTQVDVV